MNKGFVKKYGTLLLLSAGAGAIYTLPYIRETFYVPMQTAMGLTNAQMGMLTSWYAIIATFAYFLGGIAADKFSPRAMLTFSFVVTGLLGIWLSFFPGYTACRIIFALMGITTVLTFWPSMVKAIRMLGSSEEQGRLYGLNEGLRGFLNAILVFAMAAVYAKYADNVAGAAQAVRVAAIVDIVVGVLCWFVIDKGNTKDQTESLGQITIGMFKCLKIPRVWLLTGILFCAYSIYGLMSYIPAYAVGFGGMTAAASANLGGFRYIIQGIGGICGGFLADKIGSRLKIITWTSIILAASYALFLFIPAVAIAPILANYFFGMMLVYVLRSMYFADVDEAGLPVEISGRVSGIMSTIGYLPDVFMLTMMGAWIDNAGASSATGYRMIFIYAIAMGLGCMLFSIILRKVIAKGKQKEISDGAEVAKAS